MPKMPLRHFRTRLTMDFLEDRSTPTTGISSASSIPDRVLVTFADSQHAAPIAPFVSSTSSLGLGAYAVTINPSMSVDAAVTYFAGQPGVIASSPDRLIMTQAVPNDPSFNSQWSLRNQAQSGGTVGADIGATQAWTVQTGTGKTIVAVIDSGVDYNHPDLAANMWTNPGDVVNDPYPGSVHGYNFVSNNGNPMDDNGHGTHVAGTIGALGNNNVGVSGVAWHTQIMALKFLDSNGQGSTSDAVRALNFAIIHHANIANCSWGGSSIDSNLGAAIGRARDAGIIVVCAAGNNSANNDSNSFYPASFIQTYDNMVTVAATDQSDKLASFSNFGVSSVTLAAPGVSIYSTTPNNTYSFYSGTSMATPEVTGALVLLRDQHPTWSYQQLIGKLKSSVDVLSSLSGKVATGGRLDVAKMLDANLVSPPPVSPPPVSPPVSPPASTPAPSVLFSSGARISSSAFSGTSVANFNRVRLTFNEPINPASFTPARIVSLTGPAGRITPLSVTAVAGTNNTQFDVNFAVQTTAGLYSIVVGPAILDSSGNPMNQNGNGVNGEATSDRYSGQASLGSRSTASAKNLPAAIPDNSTLRIPIVVTDAKRIVELTVQLSVSHERDSDLIISLQSPNGSIRLLTNRYGGNGQNFTSTLFDDSSSRSIALGSAPFSGSYRPEQSLSSFNGLNAQGTWTLIVRDVAAQKTGKVTGVTLSILGVPIPQIASVQATVQAQTERASNGQLAAAAPAVWVGPVKQSTPLATSPQAPAYENVRLDPARMLQAETATQTVKNSPQAHANLAVPLFQTASPAATSYYEFFLNE
ncbi:MAG: S8 family serine peptidase [Gemmataceae bacterium]